MPSYDRLQTYAIAISIISILYCSAEGAVSIAFGEESSSRSLIFFGIQSGIEVASACIVLWRFRKRTRKDGVQLGDEENAVGGNNRKNVENRDTNENGNLSSSANGNGGGEDEMISAADLRVERIGTYSVGILVLLLSLATLASSLSSLILHTQPSSSLSSLIISASALVCMVLIYLPKRYLARALNSSTMAGEAVCSLSCIQITLVLFIGSLIYKVWPNGWWVDAATSLVLAGLFGREAYKMLSWVKNPNFNGGCCDACGKHGPSAGGNVKVEELQEQYRDLCECCYEKDECRDSDTCKCESSSEEEEPCCVPVDPKDGAKCCSRELVPGQRPTPSVPGTQTRSQAHSIAQVQNVNPGQDNTSKISATEGNNAIEWIDSIDSPSSSGNKTTGDVIVDDTTKSAGLTAVSLKAFSQEKQGCCSGCCSD